MGVKHNELAAFHREIAPFYIRRLLTDVVDDMPEKIRAKPLEVELTPRQRRDYDAMHKYQVAQVGEAQEELVVTYKIAMFTRLQQMAAGTVELDWSKFDLGKAEGPSVRIGEPSPKIDALFELFIDPAVDAGESVVVFTQFNDMADLVEARCKKQKIKVGKYSGRTPDQLYRDQVVRDFQARKTSVFVGTIGSAGQGITLTAAHTLVFLDRHWNPSKNEQAEDRIWRLGQKNQCRIYDIVMKDTIEDERLKTIWEKAKRVKEIVTLPAHLNEQSKARKRKVLSHG
jgi:SNF2 family DNA or RNA helicase